MNICSAKYRNTLASTVELAWNMQIELNSLFFSEDSDLITELGKKK